MMIKTKDDSVNLWGLKVEMQPVLKHAAKIWADHGLDFVVTSGRDGIHSPGSYHYYGYAVDLRTWSPSGNQLSMDEKKGLAGALTAELAKISDYFDIHIHTSHIHIEYDWVKAQRGARG